MRSVRSSRLAMRNRRDADAGPCSLQVPIACQLPSLLVHTEFFCFSYSPLTEVSYNFFFVELSTEQYPYYRRTNELAPAHIAVTFCR